MKTVLRNDPRYLLLAVPSVIADSSEEVDQYVDAALTKQSMFDEGDYFIMPLDQTSLYQEAVELAKRNAARRGFECEITDRSNAVIRVSKEQAMCSEYHLRIVFVGDSEGSDLVN